VACCLACLPAQDAVRALTPDDFDSFVGGDKAAFVEFYAPVRVCCGLNSLVAA
jgi:hypothetical protein